MRARQPRASLALALLMVVALSLPAASASQNSPSPQDPVTAAPPVSRPPTASCSVVLMQNQSFQSGYSPFQGSYAPPAGCAAPWAKVVLDWKGTVAGTQFDRIGAVWIGGTDVFRTSTPEPPGHAISWQVAKDVSEYEPLLTRPQNVTAIVSNSVGGKLTGVIYVTAVLTFYQTSSSFPAASHPDEMIPLSSGGTPGFSSPWFVINSGGSVNVPLTLPRNLVRAYVEVYATPHGCDEAWYGNQTTAYARANGLCGGTAFREIQVMVDGRLAGVVWPFPLIYTGGWNPYLWQQIPGVDAFDIPPYLVDITPFVGLLGDGLGHTLTITVLNNFDYWRIDGSLLLFTDGMSQATSGALTSYQVQPEPYQRVVLAMGQFSQTLDNGSAAFRCPQPGSQLCIFTTTAARSLFVGSYVDTSLGRVATTINETMSFENTQTVDLVNGMENLAGEEEVVTTTTTMNASGTFVETADSRYPIDITSAFITPNAGRDPIFILPAVVNQTQEVTIASAANGRTVLTSSLVDTVTARALWEGNMTSDANILTSGETAEHYLYQDSTGGCFDHTVSSSQDALTEDVLNLHC